MDVRELVKRPPMYGTYYITKGPTRSHLSLRTFGCNEVDWTFVCELLNDEVELLKSVGIKEWN